MRQDAKVTDLFLGRHPGILLQLPENHAEIHPQRDQASNANSRLTLIMNGDPVDNIVH